MGWSVRSPNRLVHCSVRCQIKATVVQMATGSYFPSGVPQHIMQEVVMGTSLRDVLAHGMCCHPL